MIILSIFIYLLYLDFGIFINLFLSDRFEIRCFRNWEYSVDGEENMQCMMEEVHTKLDVCKDLLYSDTFHKESVALWVVKDVSDRVDSMEKDLTIQDARN